MRYSRSLLLCFCILFSGSVFAEAEQACVVSGISPSGEQLNDCVINTGISEQTEFGKFCYEYTELRSSFQRAPEPKIGYAEVCPAQEQAQCIRPAAKGVQVLFYGRTSAQLSLEQEYCDLLGGQWALATDAEQEEVVTDVSEIYNLCNYLDDKSFVSLESFSFGLSLISYFWKLEFGNGTVLWRKNADQTELLRYSCRDGEIDIRSMQTGERYTLDASIYSNSVTFEGVAYDQLLPKK